MMPPKNSLEMLEWQPIELFIACIQFEPKIEMPIFFSQHEKTAF